MTRAEMRAEVYRRLREASSFPVFWQDTDIEVSLQEGYEEMTDSSEWYETYQTVPILQNRPYYDMRTVCRDQFLVLGRAFNVSTNRWLQPTTPVMLDLGDSRWERRVMEPDQIMIRGLWWVGYWPIKGSESGKIKQYFKGFPTPMAADTDSPAFEEEFHYGLVEYALWDLFAQDSEVDLAWAAWKEFLRYEDLLMKAKGKRNGVPKMNAMSPMSPVSDS